MNSGHSPRRERHEKRRAAKFHEVVPAAGGSSAGLCRSLDAFAMGFAAVVRAYKEALKQRQRDIGGALCQARSAAWLEGLARSGGIYTSARAHKDAAGIDGTFVKAVAGVAIASIMTV
jgi:hypothetical protein